MASAMILAADLVSFRGELFNRLALLLLYCGHDMYSMTTDSKLEPGEPALMHSVTPNHPVSVLALRALAAVSNPFRLYQHHVNGA